MKKLLLIFFIISLSSFAGEGSSAGGNMLWRMGVTPETSWEVINSFDNIIVRYPSIQVKGSYISYDSFCLGENDHLISEFTKIECLVKESDGYCREQREVILETPRIKDEKKCVEKKWSWGSMSNRCIRYETIQKEIPLSTRATLNVLDQVRGEEYEGFSKKYIVPNCQ